MALSDNYLYLTFNVYSTDEDEEWLRAVALRMSLDELGPDESLEYDSYTTTEYGGLRLTRGAGDTMYFASSGSSAKNHIRVWKWGEDSNVPSQYDIFVSPWTGEPDTYVAQGPDGNNWLGRMDDRITGAWIAEGLLVQTLM